MLGGAAGEVERQALAVDGRARARSSRSPSAPRARPRACADAVGELARGRRGCGARRSRAPSSKASRQRARRRGGRASSRSRRAPTRLAASWARRSARRCSGLAHLRDELGDRVLVERRAARSPRPPRRACGCRPASSRASGRRRRRGGRGWRRSRSASSPGRPSEDRRDHGDVGQVGAARDRGR